MGSLFPKPISGERLNIVEVDGVATIDGTVPITATGSVQPLSGKEAESFNILRQGKGLVQVFCGEKLVVGEEGTTNGTGDIIFWDGRKWELIKELTRDQGLINHQRYAAQYVGVQ